MKNGNNLFFPTLSIARTPNIVPKNFTVLNKFVLYYIKQILRVRVEEKYFGVVVKHKCKHMVMFSSTPHSY